MLILPKSNRKASTLSFYLDKDWQRRLDKLCEKVGMFRSQLIAGMLKEKIKEVEEHYEVLMEDKTLPQFKQVERTLK